MAATPTSALSFQNFFQATLTADMTATSLDVSMDAIPNGTEGFLVIDPDSTTAREVVYYTSKTATKVTCPSVADGRGQDDTTAGAHLQGTTVIMAPIAAYFEALVALFTTSPQGWTALTGTFTGVTALGNRSYSIATSADQRTVLSPGHRIRLTRNTTAPTQCTSLNGTTQYWSKTSPAGMTFTNNFVVSAWVKVSSYQNTIIMSRFSATNGWYLQLNSSGQINLVGFNAGAGNFSQVTTYQSLPLNKWVHVAAQLDMLAFTATTTTSYVMFDGADVPANVSRGGTNPTALVQAGNLEVGSYNGGLLSFPGKIAQAAVFSAKVTQTTIQSYYSQGLVGTETNLVSAYSFNGVATDLNATNANNLTATASAGYTTDSPFAQGANAVSGYTAGKEEFGIVQAITASTINVFMAEGSAVPTTGTISNAYYSTYKAPYGFPSQVDKWSLYALSIAAASQSSPVAGTWYNLGGLQITAPIGVWDGSYELSASFASSAVAPLFYSTFSTANNTQSDATTGTYTAGTSAGTVWAFLFRQVTLNLAAAANYYVNLSQAGTGGGTYSLAVNNSPSRIVLKNAYL